MAQIWKILLTRFTGECDAKYLFVIDKHHQLSN
jgi:hypothetical protein